MRLRVKVLIATLGVPLTPAIAGAQEAPPILPGDEPETVYGIPFWLGVPMLAAIVGLALLLALLYFRYSRRFYGREEPPPPRQRPRFAGMAAAQPAAAAPQGAATARAGATAAAKAAGEAPAPPKPQPAQQAAAQAAAPAGEAPAPPKPQPAQQAAAQAAAPAAEAQATKAQPPEQAAPAEEKPPEQAAPAEEKPAEQPKPAGGPVEPDQETFDRVLAEQVDKGVDRRVAEGRARAAAIKAAREKTGG